MSAELNTAPSSTPPPPRGVDAPAASSTSISGPDERIPAHALATTAAIDGDIGSEAPDSTVAGTDATSSDVHEPAQAPAQLGNAAPAAAAAREVRVFNPAEGPGGIYARREEGGEGSTNPTASSSSALAPTANTSATGATAPAPASITPDESFFEPTLSDVQAHHAAVVARSKRLNEAPLLTSKFRDEEREAKERKKADKWPTTTIRVKFSDGTQIQSTFPSTSPIQPVYAFVREALQPDARDKPFTLWQPPRFTYPEHPLPSTTTKKAAHVAARGPAIVTPANYGLVRGAAAPGLSGGTGGRETLNELGLVPQSVLMVRWGDEGWNATGFPAPLLAELRQKAEPLPAAQPISVTTPASGSGVGVGGGKENGSGQDKKKIPKWLAKGLMKKK